MTIKSLRWSQNLLFVALILSTPWVNMAIAGHESSAANPDLIWRECLVIKAPGRAGRSAVHTDAIEATIIAGHRTRPHAGETVTLPDGRSLNWTQLTLGTNGWFENEALEGGYAYMSITAEREQVRLLEASGHTMVYVNGEPRAGDNYSYGYVRLPVVLKPGTNDFLFHVARGKLKAALAQPKAEVAFDLDDLTMPDLVVRESTKTWGALLVVNASQERREDLIIRSTLKVGKPIVTPVPTIPPMTIRKVGVRLEGGAPPAGEEATLNLELAHKGHAHRAILDHAVTRLRVRQPLQTEKRTFISGIDGSVQYYAVNPAQPPRARADRPALFLSLHGASVEAIGQADAYSSKTWGHIVAPTNRRPYGFDWEDWGRMDAMEVLNLAQHTLKTDPQRTYLTGHSMGGHGVWQLGAIYPDRFAAIGPSAGWISFWSYAGSKRFENPTPVEALFQRATASSDTLVLASNYLHEGIYILHGDKDDNVPVTEARQMKAELTGFHHDFQLYEQPGAGHWWDVSDEPGADCVDWPRMFDFFARHALPLADGIREVNFTTVNPGVSAWCNWAGIEAQIQPMLASTINIRWDPWKRRFVGRTANVARLVLSLEQAEPGKPVEVELDQQKIENISWPADSRLWLLRDGDRWRLTSKASLNLKGPHRYGPFKAAFRDQMFFVYATKGTPEENAWAFNKARFDAESFWYRGNGSVDVIADTAFDLTVAKDRGVILYGNADSNGAWPALLGGSPVQVHRGEIRVGDRHFLGDDLACLFLRPRAGSDRACVGVVSGSGVAGMKLTDRLPYFLAGVAYPDLTILGPEMLSEGSRGIRAAGFFGLDWSVEKGEFAWRAEQK